MEKLLIVNHTSLQTSSRRKNLLMPFASFDVQKEWGTVNWCAIVLHFHPVAPRPNRHKADVIEIGLGIIDELIRKNLPLGISDPTS